MSSSGFESTLDLRFAPGHRALRWLYVLHLLPLALVAFAMQPGPPMLAVAALFALSWFWLRRHAAFGFGGRALVRALWQPERGWRLWLDNGAEIPAQLLPRSFVHPSLIVLSFCRLDGKVGHRHIGRVILGDELEAAPLRRLRALLISGAALSGEVSGSGGSP